MKDHLAAAMQQQAYPFDQLVQQLVKRRDASRNPIFDTMFVYQNMGLPAVENYGMILTRHDFDPGFSKFDLSLEIFEEENIAYAFEYATALFKEETIEKLAGHFLNLLQEIVRHPNKEIKTLSLLDKDEYSSYVEAYNATEAIYPKNKSIHQVFEEQVARTPGSIAVEWGDVQLTYQQLNQKANALAIELRDRGLKPNEVVCILLSRSTDFLISVLGILKAGACFLPIDTNLPAKRIRFILEDSACKILLTKSEQPLAPPAQVYRIDMDQWMPNASPVNYLKSVTKADDLAYVIYTSGTTGRPKGVMISHRSLVNYIDYCCKTYVKGESADFPLFTSVSFDLTITSIFTPLASGHRILIYEDDPKAVLIEKIVADDRVDIIKLTPSHLRIIRECFLKNSHLNSRIKRFIIGGEALETALARQIYIGFNGKVELFNEYGPTEATVGCMIHKYQLEDTTASVPIGFPIQNTAIYLLDQYLCPVPLGVKGEVYISGSGVARGYLFNDQLTTERFIDDPFVANRKMYKTGDVARRLPNSGLEFIERVDLQVKINGYRIELTEIEQQMLSHEQVSEALVSIEDHANGQKLLYAYYMCEPSTDLTIDQATLRHYLASRLPHYMMPVHFIKLDEIPLTINGKVNYSALPKPKADKARPEGTLPGGMVEAVSLEAWEEVFGQKVNVTDNFFELGGDSIKAVQIASRLSEKGVGIVVKDILTYQTIGQISKHAKISFKDQHYEQGVVEGARKATPIEQWFFSRQLQNPHYFNQSVLLKLQRKVDRRLLERSFDLLIAHHDGLRLNYDWHAQNLYYNNNHLNERFDIQELSFDELPQFKATLRLEEGLLLKAALLRQIKEEETYLFITAHHLLVDGISWRIFLEDLHSCYNALESGHSPQLPRKAASLMDWKKALDEYQNAADWQQEKSFWEEVKTANCELPQDMETTDWRVAQAANISASLDADATAYLLKEAHKAYKTDVPILLNTALLMALHKWTDQRQFIIEQENHGRHLDHLDTSRTLGWFTCMFPLKLYLLDGPLDEQIKSVKEQIRQVPAKGIGYGLSCEAEDWQREKQSQIRFNYLGQFDHELENDLFSYSTLATSSDVAPENAMTTKLECNLMVVRNCLKIDIQYNRNAHHRTTIERLKESFIKSIHRLLDHIREEEQIHFTPSDFDAADVKQEELDALFD
ncbi:MAG: amino acid adenylation domain-containing protein [Bacteroidota bacterium]